MDQSFELDMICVLTRGFHYRHISPRFSCQIHDNFHEFLFHFITSGLPWCWTWWFPWGNPKTKKCRSWRCLQGDDGCGSFGEFVGWRKMLFTLGGGYEWWMERNGTPHTLTSFFWGVPEMIPPTANKLQLQPYPTCGLVSSHLNRLKWWLASMRFSDRLRCVRGIFKTCLTTTFVVIVDFSLWEKSAWFFPIFGESHGASPGVLFAKPILGRCLHCYLVAMVQSSTIGDMQIEVAVSW